MNTVIIHPVPEIDLSRGVDVLRGSKVLKHFDNYADARAYACEGHGRYLRYWGVKPQPEQAEK